MSDVSSGGEDGAFRPEGRASIPTEGLSALTSTLEKAEAGSREMDAAIWMMLVECDRAPFRYWAPVDENHGHEQVHLGALYYAPHCAQVFVTPETTTSLDAALALAERVLPGWCWEVRTDRDGTGVQGAPGWWNEGLASIDIGGVAVEAPTPALALCVAILKAVANSASPVSVGTKAKPECTINDPR